MQTSIDNCVSAGLRLFLFAFYLDLNCKKNVDSNIEFFKMGATQIHLTIA